MGTKRTTRAWSLAALGLALLLLLTASARAQSPGGPSSPPRAAPEASAGPAAANAPTPSPDALAEAKELNRRGVALLEAGDVERALEHFRKSRALYPSGKNVTNEAICLRKLKRYDEALEAYELVFTQYAGDLAGDDRAALAPAMAELREKLGDLWVSSNVEGSATVLVDGTPRATLPLAGPIRVMAGERVIRVVRSGYETYETRLKIDAQGAVTVDAKLEPLRQVGQLRVEDADGKPATVLVDGVEMGPAPWEGLLQPGAHVVWTRRGELGSAPQAVTVVASQIALVRPLAFPLGPELHVEAEPRSARIEIDGVGLGTGAWTGRLPEGKHSIKVLEEGYFTETESIESSAGQGVLNRTLRLGIDPDHPRWPKPPSGNFWLGAFGGFSGSGGIGAGAAEDCSPRCTNHPWAYGGMGGVRGGFRFPVGISIELGGGYWWLGTHIERVLHDQFEAGGTRHTVTYHVDDSISVRGPFFELSHSYRVPLGKVLSFQSRLGIGLLFAAASDDLQGTASTTGPESPIILGNRDTERAVALFVMPELGAEAKLGPVDIGVTLGLAIFPLTGPTFPNQPFSVTPTHNQADPGDVGNAGGSRVVADERAYGIFALWVPQLSLSHTF